MNRQRWLRSRRARDEARLAEALDGLDLQVHRLDIEGVVVKKPRNSEAERLADDLDARRVYEGHGAPSTAAAP